MMFCNDCGIIIIDDYHNTDILCKKCRKKLKGKSCIFCGDILSSKNVYMFNKRKNIVNKCESCTDKLESGVDMYD